MKLMITLGHNSSAVLAEKYNVLCGYEEERLSKIKSDSSYPKLAIEEILKYFPEAREKVTDVFVSHWFWIDGNEMQESKYWLPKHIKARFPNAKITSVNENFTHHDAHAGSVWNFSCTKEGLTIVADGFGTNGETISVYRDGELVDRHFGISLGLMYQFMTSALGMKENQDEYKMLGLEALVDPKDEANIKATSMKMVELFYNNFYSRFRINSVEDIILVNKKLFSKLHSICEHLDNNGKAYCVQKLIENVILDLLEEHYNDDEVLQFSGGLFYNVKLNNLILNSFADRVRMIEFMPLAGDQGAALGMTELMISHVFWGYRETNKFDLVHDNRLTFQVEGRMEFGPRALGNTSCIALPSVENVELINKLNGRPNIMPMAPMISTEYANRYCKNIHVLGHCKKFMICATDWIGPIDEYRGVLHKKPFQDSYTCRPQVIDNCHTAVNNVVINTSLNAHGQPILLSSSDYSIMVDKHERNA